MSRPLALLLVLAPLGAYAPGLSAPFVYDDLHSIRRNPHLTLANAGRFFVDASLFDENPRTRMYRPVLLLSYSVDALFWDRDPLGFHLTNLLLHVVTGLVLAFLLRDLVGASGGGAALRRLAPWGAALFLLHPAASESVLYVSCRSSLLATLGCLGALWAYLRRIRGGGWGWSLGGGAAFLLALGSKAIAVILPAALVLVELLWGGRRWRRVLPFLLLVLAYLGVRQAVLGHTGVDLTLRRLLVDTDPLTGKRSVRTNLLTQAAVFWRYLELVFFPLRLNIAHHAPVLREASDPRFLRAAVGLALYALLAARTLRRRPRAGFALVWFPLALAPTSSLVPLNVVMNEHRLYLPLTLFGPLLVLEAARALPPRVLRAAGAVLLLVLGARTAWRAGDYRDPYRLWGGAVALAPENYRAWIYFGNAQAARGDLVGARRAYRRALRLHPPGLDARVNLGEVCLRLAATGRPGALAEGEAALREVLRREPRHVLARLKLLRLLLRRGDLDGAAAEVREVLRRARGPRFRSVRRTARRYEVLLAERRGRLREALRLLLALLREEPLSAAVHARLAGLYRRLGRPDRARRHAELARRLRGGP